MELIYFLRVLEEKLNSLKCVFFVFSVKFLQNSQMLQWGRKFFFLRLHSNSSEINQMKKERERAEQEISILNDWNVSEYFESNRKWSNLGREVNC